MVATSDAEEAGIPGAGVLVGLVIGHRDGRLWVLASEAEDGDEINSSRKSSWLFMPFSFLCKLGERWVV